MPRIARVVVPGLPHHITQRGNRRQQVFFCDGDYEAYKALLAEHLPRFGIRLHSYVLIPNHSHLEPTPPTADAFAHAIAIVNGRYASLLNRRLGTTGHVWQGRFHSCVLDERHTVAVAGYIVWNPVRAGLVARPEDWPHSSARHHLGVEVDPVMRACGAPIPGVDWRAVLERDAGAPYAESIRKASRTGRPLGDPLWVRALERATGRSLAPRPRGPRPRLGRGA